MPIDLEQTRASRAFTAVRGLGEAERGGFLKDARKLPTFLRTNGLLASYARRPRSGSGGGGGSEKGQLATELWEALEEHLEERHAGAFAKLIALFGNGDEEGGTLTTLELQRLTAEAVVFAGWLKRAAEAFRSPAEDGSDGQSPSPGEAAPALESLVEGEGG